MMELLFQNNQVCVYSVQDWKTLRTKYRIVGVLTGSATSTPALPVILLPEEAALLISKGVIRIVTIVNVENNIEHFNKLRDDLLVAEREVYRETRKDSLDSMMDKIMDGKKRKKCTKSREEVFEEELNKSCDISESNMIWPVLSCPLQSSSVVKTETPEHEILKSTNPIKCAIYADLWNKGHYITSGVKFGGDFLVYLGDPVSFHAVYIVRCVVDPTQEQHPSELVAFGRLGTSVKKRPVLASFNENTNEINYITLNWIDLSLLK